MKDKTGLLVPYVLMVISLFLPWFTYNAKVMGYCWGTQYVLYFLIPLVLVGTYLFCKKPNKLYVILAEFGAIMNLVLLVIVFGTWQEGRNIIEGFHWRDGFRTAQPAFWCAAVCAVLVFVLLQYHIFFKNRKADSSVGNKRGIALGVSALIVLLTACIIIASFLIEHHSEVINDDSELYSREEMESAVEIIKKTFYSWQGCKLYSIEYAGDDYCVNELSYCNTLNHGETAFTQCIVFRTRFRSPVFGGGAWNANSVYNWSWYLARTGEGNWQLLTWGVP